MNLNEIESNLLELPDLIEKQAFVVESAWLNFEQAKHDLEVKRSSKSLQADNGDKKKTVSTIQAEVNTDSEIVLEESALILKEGIYRTETVKLDCLSNKFGAVRKIANLETSKLQAGV